MTESHHGLQVHQFSVDVGNTSITFETGRLAKQAGGSVLMTAGDSQVLVTAVAETSPSRFDFLPLTVNYMDKTGSYGAIPGGFLKRETGRSERETLICRLIDRPIRPMFPKTFRHEMQIIATVLSFDGDNDTDVLSLCGASAAMMLSPAPMSEPIAGVRIVKHGGEWHLNPTRAVEDAADVNLVIAGTSSAITMVEGGGSECAESDILDALDVAHEAIKAICKAINDLVAVAGQETMTVPEATPPNADTIQAVFDKGAESLRAAMATPGKHVRKAALKAARNLIIADLVAGIDDATEVATITADAKTGWSKLLRKTMRSMVLSDGVRLDGRATDEIRSIWTEVSTAPRAHGSAVFTRGETQGFVTATLGIDADAQIMDLPSGREDRRFMLTYNFPPFCTGEVRRVGAPKRREVGHGALARRGLLPVLPTKEEFPYVLRCTSEIFESNGSSSMATVCGSSMAMMDAGVPLKAAVAGIAMGLIKEGDDYAVISDILGDEDALGDMDFKVTGTTEGITAFQMDTKISGVSREIMAKALAQAREGRIHILGEMAKTLASHRDEMSEYAPRITTLTIKTDKIRDLIGPGGKTIRNLQEVCKVRINVDDTGRVNIASSSQGGTDKALAMIREITQEAEIGALYVGLVKRITDFGAFVEIFPGTDGLVHISHLAHQCVERVRDVLNEGDEVLVRVIDIDRSGKIRLSRKEALETAVSF
jgi:polyribonucleotide nucleotidyltransferase